MSDLLQISPRHRILVLAPHPDDESLATGGLLQRAVARGAAVRVLLVSDGDNNPWPQRYLERRVWVGAEQRRAWGARRRAEAMAALRQLGVDHSAVRFLGWPDQGETRSLLDAHDGHAAVLAEELATFRPNLVVAPSMHDTHPDHNALAVQLEIALDLCEGLAKPKIVRFFVHPPAAVLPKTKEVLRLTPGEQAVKREAILCHGTQMALSRKRFVGYARPTEHFYPTDAAPAGHPIRSAEVAAGALVLHLRPARSLLGRGRLLIASQSLSEGNVRWSLPLKPGASCVRLREACTGRLLRKAVIRSRGADWEVRIPLAPVMPVARIFVKFDRRLAFYDEGGWREVPVLASELLPCPSDLPLPETSRSSSWSARWSLGGTSAG